MTSLCHSLAQLHMTLILSENFFINSVRTMGCITLLYYFYDFVPEEHCLMWKTDNYSKGRHIIGISNTCWYHPSSCRTWGHHMIESCLLHKTKQLIAFAMVIAVTLSQILFSNAASLHEYTSLYMTTILHSVAGKNIKSFFVAAQPCPKKLLQQ